MSPSSPSDFSSVDQLCFFWLSIALLSASSRTRSDPFTSTWLQPILGHLLKRKDRLHSIGRIVFLSDIGFCITSAGLHLSGIHSLCQFLITYFPFHQLSLGKNKSIYLNWWESTAEGKKENSRRWSLSPVDHSFASHTQASVTPPAWHGHLSVLLPLFAAFYKLQGATSYLINQQKRGLILTDS